MATVPACISCQERLSCADSALSMTANVIGILTFVSAVIISIQVYLNSIGNATREISITLRRMESRIVEVKHLEELLEKKKYIGGTSKKILAFGIQRSSQILKDCDHLFGSVTRSGLGGKRNRFSTSARFLYMADDLKSYIGKADDILDTIRGELVVVLR